MPDVFKPTYHRDIPSQAKIITRRGKKFAQFVQSTGRTVDAEVLPCGKRCRIKTEEYYSRIWQSDGRILRVPLGVSDKEAARQSRAKLQLEADRQKAGIIDPSADHRRRPLIGSMKPLPKRRHKRDRNGHIIRLESDIRREDLERVIGGSHLADYRPHLLGADRSSGHIWEVVRVIRRVAIACKFLYSHELDSNLLDRYLGGLIAAGKSYRTRNAALKSVRAFVRWMIRSDRLERDSLKMLSAINEEGDPNRRPQSPPVPRRRRGNAAP